jgi:predicted enzyme related to lactoylglutathione lyase
MRVEIAMMRTPDGHGPARDLAISHAACGRRSPERPGERSLGHLRIMFAVEDIDDTLARLRKHGAQLVGEVVQYEDVYRLCYTRGPEGLLIGLAEQIG